MTKSKSKLKAAQERNFRILRRRAMYQSVKVLFNALHKTSMLEMIDDQLSMLGAETEEAREWKRRGNIHRLISR